MVFGLLCTADGCPVAVEVFAGDVGDPKTLAAQIDKLKKRFASADVPLRYRLQHGSEKAEATEAGWSQASG